MKQAKKIIISLFAVFAIAFGNYVFAIDKSLIPNNISFSKSETDKVIERYKVQKNSNIIYSEAYLNWLALSDIEKANTIEPRMEYIAFNTLNGNKKNVFAQKLPSTYNLNTAISIPVENQGAFGTCYAFASLNAIETNISLKQSVNYNFSEMHIDYMTSKYFRGTRELDSGGNFQTVTKYVNDLYGPVLESQITNKSYNQYNSQDYALLTGAKPIVNIIQIKEFPTINKNYDYTPTEIKTFRDSVKTHIMTNGSLYASIYWDKLNTDYNELTNSFYYCESEIKQSNHAITIIGWDDNYSKENFVSSNRPINDGAYLAQNSWGSSWGNNGLFYISYEDVWVEYNMSGVVATSNFVDTYSPLVVGSNYTKTSSTLKITVKVNDIGGNSVNESSLKYQWTESPTVEPSVESFSNSFVNGNSITKTNVISGQNWYLWVIASDNIGNTSISTVDLKDLTSSDGKYKYSISSNGNATITGYIGNPKANIFEIPSIIDGTTVTTIGDSAFYECNLLTGMMIIPETVTTIEDFAFAYCSSITWSYNSMPSSLKTIGYAAFYACDSISGRLNLSNTITSIGDYAFAFCSSLDGFLHLPNNITSIGTQTFCGCSKLVGGLTIPSNVKEIGTGAFAYCSGFSSNLVLSNTLENISFGAFEGCSKLKGPVNLPSTLKSIGSYAFYQNRALTGNLIIPASVESIGNYSFSECTNLNGYLVMPKTLTDISSSAFLNTPLTLDNTAPIAGTAEFRTSDNAIYTPGTWTNKQSVTIVLTNGSDLGSGHKSTTINTTYVSASGVTSVIVTTTDNVGNVSTREYEVKIDRVAPIAGTIDFTTVDGVYTPNTWTNKTVIANAVNGSDELSGHKTSIVNISSIFSNGNTVVNVVTTDNAENTAMRTYTVKIDKVAPITGQITEARTEDNEIYIFGNWTTQNVTINSWTDSLDHDSGLASSNINTTSVNKSGTTNVIITATDNAGNTSSRIFVVNIDRDAPTAGHATFKTSDGKTYIPGTWTNQTVIASVIDGSDNLSEHKSTEVSETNITESKTVIVTTTDNVGNISTREYEIKIDKNVPTAGYATFKTSDGKTYKPGTWTNKSVTATVTNGSDSESGHKSTEISTKIITSSKITTVIVTTTDNAGNKSTRSYSIKIDKIKPKVGYATFKTSKGKKYTPGKWTKYTIYIKAKGGSDSLSGLKSTKVNYTKVSKKGTKKITLTTYDNAGNKSTRTYYVKKR